MLNFNWWVNRKDPEGHNVFAGGFLGLDNIGVFDRSAPLPPVDTWTRPTARHGWLSIACACWRSRSFSQSTTRCMRIWPSDSSSISSGSPTPWIGSAHHDECGTTEEGFFYDLLRLPNGDAMRLKVRSMVGLLPLCAATVFERVHLQTIPECSN